MKALITGASSGIGRDMAIYLDSLGYETILVARDKNELNKISKKLNNKSKVLAFDLSIRENNFKLYENVKDENIDFLVIDAGSGLFGNFIDTDLDIELNMIDLNIVSLHVLTKLFLKDFILRDKGIILNVASSAGFMAGPKLSTYYSTKNYVLKESLAIYEEVRRVTKNVHISILCPGPVRTNFNKVAGGSFNTKSATSDYVARYAIDKTLKNKLIIIPTIKMKLAIFFYRFLSTKLLLKVSYYIQNTKIRRMEKNKYDNRNN